MASDETSRRANRDGRREHRKDHHKPQRLRLRKNALIARYGVDQEKCEEGNSGQRGGDLKEPHTG
jgi:hypothetical protein